MSFWYTSKEGPMRLVEVRSNQLRYGRGPGMNWNRIILKGRKLFCITGLHAFVGIRDSVEMTIRGCNLKPMDRIWLDVSAFGSDGSLRNLPVIHSKENKKGIR